jgi:hypothetical protein
MCVSHNLFEAFKEDVTVPVIPVTVYADTFCRQIIDTAGKICPTCRETDHESTESYL